MSSMPILDPVPEPMETDLPSEEVIVCCIFVYVFLCYCVGVFQFLYRVYCGVQGEVCADYDVFQDVVISNVSVYKCVSHL